MRTAIVVRHRNPLPFGFAPFERLPCRLLWEMFTKRLFGKFLSTWPHSRKFWGTRNLLLAFNRQSNHPPTTRINFIKMLTRRAKYSTRKPCPRPEASEYWLIPTTVHEFISGILGENIFYDGHKKKTALDGPAQPDMMAERSRVNNSLSKDKIRLRAEFG